MNHIARIIINPNISRYYILYDIRFFHHYKMHTTQASFRIITSSQHSSLVHQMALKRTITKRFIGENTPFNYLSSQKPFNATKSYFHREPLTPSHNPSPTNDAGFFRRFLQRRKINQSSTMSLPELFSFPVGERLREKLYKPNREQRLRFEGLQNPVNSVVISVDDAKKILRVSQLNKVRTELKEISANSITYSEFVTFCIDICGNHDQGVESSKMLDEAGDVIVLGNVVFLHPDQVLLAFKSLQNFNITTIFICII